MNLDENETENLPASGRIFINSFIILIIVTTPGNDSANRFSLLYYFSAMNISEDSVIFIVPMPLNTTIEIIHISHT